MAKYTKDDVQYLAQCIKGAKSPGAKPFAFLLGAGMSLSAGIPLARDLVKKINAEPEFSMHLRGLSDAEKSSYQKCMAKLSKEDRRRLLDPSLRHARVNWASLSVAALMKHEFVSRVLTFNFDSVLARACGISGHYPATYDFSVNPPEDFNFMREGAIIHLHGQGAGLVMLNSERETREHAEKLQYLFANTLESHNLVVIGYSGEADHAFQKLSDKFSGSNRLFWIGHDEDPRFHVENLIAKYPDTSFYWGGADADLFLIELAKQLPCWPPVLFREPEQHLIDELTPVIDFPIGLGGKNILKSLRENLGRQLIERRAAPIDFQSLLLEDDYEEIIAHSAEANNPEKLDALKWAYIMQGNALSERGRDSRDELHLRESFTSYAHATEVSPNEHEAYHNWGGAILDLAKIKQDVSLFWESIDKFSQVVRIKSDSDTAFSSWGNALAHLAKIGQQEQLYLDSFRNYAEAVKINPSNWRALSNWGLALLDLAEMKGEEDLYHTSIEKFRQASVVRPNSPEILNNWGTACYQLAKISKNALLYSDSFDKFAEALKIKPDFCQALSNWGTSLADLARLQDDSALYDKSFSKYSDAVRIDPELYDAYVGWGSALSSLWQLNRDERLAYESLKKFSEANRINSDDCICLLNWGLTLLHLAEAKQDHVLFRESIKKFTEATKVKPTSIEAVSGWCASLLALWRLTGAEELLHDAMEKAECAQRLGAGPSYNLACIFALLKKEGDCRRQLALCRDAKTLPSADHVASDVDLSAYSDTPWFRDFLASLS